MPSLENSWAPQPSKRALSGKVGAGYGMSDEAKWEKAARGTEGYEWPWGNDFHAVLCNSREMGKLCTTPVGAYSPRGDSVYGVADMSGNVWEWTLTLWGKDREKPDYVYPYVGDDGRENQSAGDGFFRIIRERFLSYSAPRLRRDNARGRKILCVRLQ